MTFTPAADETAWQIVTLGVVAVGTLDDVRIEYHGGLWYRIRSEAWTAGLEQVGSDDFQIGEVHDGRLLRLWWHDDVIEETPADLAEIAEQIGCQP